MTLSVTSSKVVRTFKEEYVLLALPSLNETVVYRIAVSSNTAVYFFTILELNMTKLKAVNLVG